MYVRIPSARDAAMIEQFRAGATLAEVGKAFGVSRERVRQIFVKHGVSNSERPRPKSWREQQDERVAANILRRWHITRDEYNAIREQWGSATTTGSPFMRYLRQRQNARKRGIGWEFTFREWWQVWQDSGQWERCGRGAGYCMARYMDAGPYRADNVYICTIAQNFSDSWKVEKANRPKGRNLPVETIGYKVKNGKRWMVHIPTLNNQKKWYGGFDTREAAERHGLSLLVAA